MPLPAARPRLADLIGLALSATCLIHCLALPMLLLLAPAIGHWIALPEWTHAAILTLALPAAYGAMRGGWHRHRRSAPAVTAAAGLALLALGLAAHEGWFAAIDPEAGDRLLTTAGALALAAAHVANWRLSHRRPCA
ncbi:MerC domain-containing protein [Sphingopyxis sp. KK2]|uniref:MerC domain-containing protein n=1 Tax=Sphingopyxis sp. KK2 TaxID=1855727 RepID=UPI00097E67F0|nr:MerC domain-containing protein [Sphingopyxis sp. KK2]